MVRLRVPGLTFIRVPPTPPLKPPTQPPKRFFKVFFRAFSGNYPPLTPRERPRKTLTPRRYPPTGTQISNTAATVGNLSPMALTQAHGPELPEAKPNGLPSCRLLGTSGKTRRFFGRLGGAEVNYGSSYLFPRESTHQKFWFGVAS